MSNKDPNSHSTSISPQAIIVLCLVGAGAAVLCAWAMFRGGHQTEEESGIRGEVLTHDGYTQAQYMRLVRLRNQEDVQRTYGYPIGGGGHGRSKAQPYAYAQEQSTSTF